MTMAVWKSVSATPEMRIYRNGDVELTAARNDSGTWWLPIPGATVATTHDAYRVIEEIGRLMAENLRLRGPALPAPVTRLREEHRDREWVRVEPCGRARCHYRSREGQWQVRNLVGGGFVQANAEVPGSSGGDTFEEFVPKTVDVLDDSHKDRKWESADGSIIFFWGKNNFASSMNWKWTTRPEVGELDCYTSMAEYAKEFGPFTEYWD